MQNTEEARISSRRVDDMVDEIYFLRSERAKLLKEGGTLYNDAEKLPQENAELRQEIKNLKTQMEVQTEILKDIQKKMNAMEGAK